MGYRKIGGWKGYDSKRHLGITTLWTGMKYFKDALQVDGEL
jgi:hypothetical protein